MRVAASLVMRGRQGCERPNTLSQSLGCSFHSDKWKQDVGECRCGDGLHTGLPDVGSAQHSWTTFGPHWLLGSEGQEEKHR